MLTELEKTSPSHPLIALFQPLIEKNNKRLQENASQYYTQIEAFATDERLKSKLIGVFIDWLLQRFRTLGKTEIEKMLLGLKQAIPDRLFCVVFRFSRRAAANGASDSLEVHRVENSASRRLQQRSCGEAGRPVEAHRLRHQMPPNTRGRERVVGRCVYKFNTSTIRQKIGCESFHASRRYTVRRPVVRI